jgi:hypothetical protein
LAAACFLLAALKPPALLLIPASGLLHAGVAMTATRPGVRFNAGFAAAGLPAAGVPAPDLMPAEVAADGTLPDASVAAGFAAAAALLVLLLAPGLTAVDMTAARAAEAARLAADFAAAGLPAAAAVVVPLLAAVLQPPGAAAAAFAGAGIWSMGPLMVGSTQGCGSGMPNSLYHTLSAQPAAWQGSRHADNKA